jgi:uncharacterized protein YegJ (DUF2314 family)
MSRSTILIVFAFLFGASPAFAERDFDEAVQLAASNAESPLGQSYAPNVAAQFKVEYADHVRQCVKDHAAGDLLRYRIIVRIEESGRVEQLWQTPLIPADACVAGVLQNQSFQKPPFAPFHVLLELESS